MMNRVGFYQTSLPPGWAGVLRFGEKEESYWKRMNRIAKSCGYCAEAIAGQITFEHVRPISAQGPRKSFNGMVACSPCNNLRANVPFLDFLEGETGTYEYGGSGEEVRMSRASKRLPLARIEAIQHNVSAYFRRFMEDHDSFEARKDQFTLNRRWLPMMLDNMLYPIWRIGPRPHDQDKMLDLYKTGLKRLFGIFGRHDPTFWLGGAFQAIVSRDLKEQPAQEALVVEALEAVRRQTKPSAIAGHLEYTPLAKAI